MQEGGCLDRYYFGKYWIAIEFLVLIFYINSVSTSTKDINISNTTNVFGNKDTTLNNTNISEASSSHNINSVSTSTEDINISKTTNVFGNKDTTLNNRNISEASSSHNINSVSTYTEDINISNTTNVFRNYETALNNRNISEASSSHNSFGISKQQENDFDLSEMVVHLDAAVQERLIHNLDKEDTELLRWLDIDLGPSDALARLKRFRRQASNSPELPEKNFLLHSISHKKLKQGKKSSQKRSQTRLEKIIPELRSTYDSGSLDPSLKRPKPGSNGSLKRSKRQAEAAVFRELPRWPGVPTHAPGAGARRQGQARTNTSFVKKKIMSMMMQSLYSAQERLWPLGPIVAKYGHLTPYRMAFIFLKLDQLVHESHSIMMYINRQQKNPDMTITKRLQMYSQLMRRSIDITYLVDYIMERVPKDQVVRIRQHLIRHEQEKLLKDHVLYAKTTTQLLQRPDE